MGQEERRDEHRNDQADKTPKAAKPAAKVGNEAKIGAIVILTLLLGLGIAIGVRAWRARAAKADPVAKKDVSRPNAEKPSTPEPPKKDPLFGNDDFKFKPTTTPQPTQTALTPPAAPKWNHPEEKSEPKRLATSGSLEPMPATSRPATQPKPPVRQDPFGATSSPVRSVSNEVPEYNGLRSSTSNDTAPRRDPPARHYSDSVASDALPRDNSYSTSRTIPPSPPATISRFGSSEPARPAYAENRTPGVSSYGGGASYNNGPSSNNSSSYSGGTSYNNTPSYNSGTSYNTVASRPSYSTPAPRREDGRYEVQPNDSYTAISKKVYGTDGYFKALLEYNRSKGNGDENLKPGALVYTPPISELERAYPDFCPRAGRRDAGMSQTAFASSQGGGARGGRTYTVTEGDTLFTIARYELGKASRWAEIYDLNRDALGKDYNYLRPGTRLTLPDGDRSDNVANRSGDRYSR